MNPNNQGNVVESKATQSPFQAAGQEYAVATLPSIREEPVAHGLHPGIVEGESALLEQQ
jgi:hypothetical protein